jgi:MHS family proline/betaine transporter-like MFS transporter
LFGLVLGLIAFALRRKLPHGETLAVAAKARSVPIVEIFRHHWKTVLNLSGLVASGFVGAYLFSIYLVTWLTENTHLSTPTILLINMLSLACSLLLTPVFSALSDRIGRKPLLMTGSLLAATLTVPLFMMMQGATAVVVIAARLVLLAVQACMNGGSTVYLVEAFPPHLRTSGLAVSLTLAAVVFGGTLPVIAVWLTNLTGSALAPAWYFAVIALLTAVLAAPMRSLDNRTT